jgi:hypothetical protein
MMVMMIMEAVVWMDEDEDGMGRHGMGWDGMVHKISSSISSLTISQSQTTTNYR